MVLSIALLVSTLMCVATNVLVLRAFHDIVRGKPKSQVPKKSETK